MAKAKRRPLIDQEFKTLLPPLTEKERMDLCSRIRNEGCLAPLVVWKERNTLLDGHHRIEICEQFKIPYKAVYISLVNRKQAVVWIVTHQTGRRNMTPEQVAYFRGKEYLEQVKDEGRPEKPAHSEQVSGSTAEKIGEKHGVGGATVRRDAKYAAAVDAMPNAEQILSGEAKLPKKEVIARSKLHCEKCDRLIASGHAAFKDCPRCAALRESGKKPDPPKVTPGKVVFDWVQAERDAGIFFRLMDRLDVAYPGFKKTAGFQAMHRLNKELAEVFVAEKKRLTGSIAA